MEQPPDFEKLISHLDDLELTTVHGRITEVVGMLIKAVVPQVKMGEVVHDQARRRTSDGRGGRFHPRRGLPFSSRRNVRHRPLLRSHPSAHADAHQSRSQLLGRVLNGLGQPLDEETKGPLIARRNLSRHRPSSRSSQTPSDHGTDLRRCPLHRWRPHLRQRSAHGHFRSSRRR